MTRPWPPGLLSPSSWFLATMLFFSPGGLPAQMASFHRELATTGRVDVALSRAANETSRARDEWAHPFYWAAFAVFRR